MYIKIVNIPVLVHINVISSIEKITESKNIMIFKGNTWKKSTYYLLQANFKYKIQ